MSTIRAGAGAGGAGGKRERDEGVGALSHRDPLEEELHVFCRPACVRAAEQLPREALEKEYKRNGGSRW